MANSGGCGLLIGELWTLKSHAQSFECLKVHSDDPSPAAKARDEHATKFQFKGVAMILCPQQLQSARTSNSSFNVGYY